ncbi:MAG: DUF4255 domain-containing protein [Minicystis sp.]
MFQDLDSTLSTLLMTRLPANLAEQISISFVTPDDQFPPTSVTPPVVNLFLYDMSENRELRSTVPVTERQLDGRVLSYPAPVRVDCSYLVTAWPKSGVPSPDQDEHRILGEVLRVLLRFREIPVEALEGSMKDLRFPIRTVVAPMSNSQSRGELWQALHGKPRAAIRYVVTLYLDVEGPEDAGRNTSDLRVAPPA